MLGAGLGLATGSSNAEGTEREELRHRQKQWWMHAREVLFTDLELSAEQAREVDAIVEAQLRNRARFQERHADLRAARRQADKERSAALRAELRAINAQLKDPPELFEEMRALLTQEQRPTFDTNRARLVAEHQAASKTRRKRRGNRPEERVRVKTE